MGFAFRLRDALFHRATFPYLRGELAARALGIHVETSEALAGLSELLLNFITGELTLFVRLLFFGDLIGERLQFAGRQVEFDRGLRGIALEQPVFAGEHDAPAGFEIGLELTVALCLGGLPLE